MIIEPTIKDRDALGEPDAVHCISTVESVDYLLDQTGNVDPKMAEMALSFGGRDILPRPVEDQVMLNLYLAHAERAALADPKQFYSR